MMPNRIDEVHLMTDQELINVLFDRFEHAIFSGRREGNTEGLDQVEDYCGDSTMCKGLTLDIVDVINLQESLNIDSELEDDD